MKWRGNPKKFKISWGTPPFECCPWWPPNFWDHMDPMNFDCSPSTSETKMNRFSTKPGFLKRAVWSWGKGSTKPTRKRQPSFGWLPEWCSHRQLDVFAGCDSSRWWQNVCWNLAHYVSILDQWFIVVSYIPPTCYHFWTSYPNPILFILGRRLVVRSLKFLQILLQICCWDLTIRSLHFPHPCSKFKSWWHSDLHLS